jgi:molybdopterin-guanine dinucleotide biosynthesis protein A
VGVTGLSGILLAGGASTRFGREKVVEPLDGEPLFHRPLRALLATCDEVVIVLAPGVVELPLPSNASGARFAHDEVAHGGPLVGVRTGLAHVRSPLAAIAGADMPGLRAELLALMARHAVTSGRKAVVLGDSDWARPLPAVVTTKAALDLADALLRGGERRLRELVGALDALVLAERVWAKVDPDGQWRRDVDAVGDLPTKPA